jgi:Protein of unknown function (DUF4013)
MAVTTPTADRPFNLNEAFAFIFRSPGWFGKILIGALCTLTSFLIIPSWILYGYMIQVSREARAGASVLPAWDKVAANLVDGLLYNVSLLIWSIPCVVLILAGAAIAGCSGSSDGGTATCTNGAGFALLVTLGVLLAVVVILVHPAIYAQFVADGFGASLRVGEVFARARRRIGLTLGMLLVGILAAIVATIGIIGLFIAILVTIPYAYFVLGHAFGQYTRLTDPQGAPVP